MSHRVTLHERAQAPFIVLLIQFNCAWYYHVQTRLTWRGRVSNEGEGVQGRVDWPWNLIKASLTLTPHREFFTPHHF